MVMVMVKRDRGRERLSRNYSHLSVLRVLEVEISSNKIITIKRNNESFSFVWSFYENLFVSKFSFHFINILKLKHYIPDQYLQFLGYCIKNFVDF